VAQAAEIETRKDGDSQTSRFGGYVRYKFIPAKGKLYGPYYYLVRSERRGDTVVQIHIKYLGKAVPPEYRSLEIVPEKREKAPFYKRGGPLAFRGHVGAHRTELWVQEGVAEKEVADLVDAFERLPPGMHGDVKVLEVYAGKGKTFRRGGRSWDETGHTVTTDPVGTTEGTVRVFTELGGRRWLRHFRDADEIMVHEVGHASFKRIHRESWAVYAKRRDAVSGSVTTGDRGRILLKAQEDVRAARSATEKKYLPTQERLYADYRAKMERASDLKDADLRFDVADPRYGPAKAASDGAAEERDSARSKLDAWERKWERARRKVPREDALYGRYLDAEVAARLAKDPEARRSKDKADAMERFVRATNKEGGLTSYSRSYRRTRPSMARAWTYGYYTENFAEATKLFYSNATPPDVEVAARTVHPETYEAWRDLMEAEWAGHAVPLKKRPREWVA